MTEMLGELMQCACKIMEIKTNADKRREITFATTTGDVFFGVVPADFEGLNDLNVNDVAYLEFFEYAGRQLVEIELINKLDRAAIKAIECPKNAEEQAFFLRREAALKSDIGYRALFVDSDRYGNPARAYLLMHDDSLVLITYRPDMDDLAEKFTSAKEFLENSKAKLKRAGEFDAIKQLQDYLAAN